MIGVAVLLGGLAWWRGGMPLVYEGLSSGWKLLIRLGLVIAVSLVVAGIAEVLVPEAWVKSALGEGSGWRGILIGTMAGVVTPAGPYIAMPIAAVMLRTGAGIGPVVAFVTGWSLLALHRLLAWEIPLVGVRFAVLRWTVCLLLPIFAGFLAGLIARSVRVQVNQ